MITNKHVRYEFEKAKKIVKTEEGKAILKTVEVTTKVALSVRALLDYLREKLGFPRMESVKPATSQKTKETTVEEKKEDK